MLFKSNRPTVVVTGANGFVGGSLVDYFCAKGWAVRAWVHSATAVKRTGVDYVLYELGATIPASRLEGVDFLVHAAHAHRETGSRSDEINLRGAMSLLKLCRQQAVKFVFLSSFSACEQAVSHYAKVKLGIEALLDPSVDLILRPGLILGRGGLFANISRTIARRKLIPLVGGGRQPVQTIMVADLCRIVEKGMINDIRGVYMVADPESISMRALLETIASRQLRRIRFVPMPIWLIYAACRIAEFFGIRIPVNSDSVLGLKHLHRVDTRDDLRVFGVEPRSLREALNALD